MELFLVGVKPVNASSHSIVHLSAMMWFFFYHSFFPFSAICMIYMFFLIIMHLFHCRVTNLSHLNESKTFPLLMKLCYSHLLSQIFHSSRPGLSCGKSPPLHWSAVFLSTSSNTWSASFPPQVTPNSHPDSNTDCPSSACTCLSILTFTVLLF